MPCITAPPFSKASAAYDTPNGSVGFRLRDHLARLEDSARIYGIKIPYTLDQMIAGL